jgi:hypothetical protein
VSLLIFQELLEQLPSRKGHMAGMPGSFKVITAPSAKSLPSLLLLLEDAAVRAPPCNNLRP